MGTAWQLLAPLLLFTACVSASSECALPHGCVPAAECGKLLNATGTTTELWQLPKCGRTDDDFPKVCCPLALTAQTSTQDDAPDTTTTPPASQETEST